MMKIKKTNSLSPKPELTSRKKVEIRHFQSQLKISSDHHLKVAKQNEFACLTQDFKILFFVLLQKRPNLFVEEEKNFFQLKKQSICQCQTS